MGGSPGVAKTRIDRVSKTMDETLWIKAKELFHEALATPLAERDEFIEQACGQDESLLKQVKQLLDSYESGFMNEPALTNVIDALSANDRLNEGSLFGRYRVIRLIGSGGMGEVYLAHDAELDRPVALKLLHRDVAEDKERLRRFIQEARAASALNHPNILTIYEIGTHEGARFIVSEYIDGDTLRDRMRSGLTPAESVDITCQVATALQAAHAAGIVHRDIKPENIMLRRDGLVKILDFGLAKLTESDDPIRDPLSALPRSEFRNPHLTAPGLVMGTVAYMSPEQARGQAVDARTDLWSLGVVFHEMLTGESPFKGDSAIDLVNSIIKHDGISVDSDALPSELRPICGKALAKDQKSRYQSAQQFLHDLQGEKKRMEYAIQGAQFITVSSTDDLRTQLIRRRPTLSAEYIVTSVKRHKLATLLSAALIVASGIGLSVYKFNGATPPAPEQNLAATSDSNTEHDLKVSRLPISVQTKDIVISPDGKYLAYTVDNKSIRIMDRATSAETDIFSAGSIWGLRFSPDSQFVYYSFHPSPKAEYTIMKLPIGGGTPVKIVDGPYDGLSFSPDGTMIAYTREDDDGQLIMLANPDGSNERKIARSDWDHMIEGSPIFAPDGKTLACNVRFMKEGYRKIVGYSVADGTPRVLSEKKWNDTWGVVWLPNGNLVVNARDGISDPSQLWAIQPGGEPKAITSGLVSYRGLSATRSGDLLVTNQVTEGDDRDLWVLQGYDARTARRVTTSGEIRGRFALTPDGLIIYGSTVSGNPDIWVMNANGGGRRQLTNDPGIDAQPAVSPDGKYIAFTSNRVKGVRHIFLMDKDGGNLKQLTDGENEGLASFSHDGKWVYFMHAPNGKEQQVKYIRKVPVSGGESTLVATAPDGWFFNGIDVNKADGRLVYGLGRFSNGWQYKLGIVPTKGEAKLIDLSGNLISNRPRWSPDNRSIVILSTVLGGPASLDAWSIAVDGKGKPRQLTDFRTPGSADPRWTADGKQLFVTRGTSISNPVLIRNSGN